MADSQAEPFPASALAEVLRITVELTRSLSAMMFQPRSFQEWVTFAEARAERGWPAAVELYLTALADGFPRNVAVRLAVDDMRAAVRRLAEFLPDLADDTSGEPSGMHQEDDGGWVEEWPQRPTEASRVRFILIRADNRGRFRRLQEAVGQAGEPAPIELSEHPSEVLRAMQVAGKPLTDRELANMVGGAPSTARHAVKELREMGLAESPRKRGGGYQLTAAGQSARHLGNDLWATVGPHSAGL